MEDQVTCSECEDIVRELAQAYAEIWDQADPQKREACTAVQKMLGGTEQDVQRAEELTQSVQYRPRFDTRRIEGAILDELRVYQALGNNYPDLDPIQRSPILRALWKKYDHEQRTGHKVPFRKPW